MKISDKGIKLIKEFEGLRLEAYKCPAGVWTIGHGHTKGVMEGDKITDEELDLWEEDFQAYHSLGENGIMESRRDDLMELSKKKVELWDIHTQRRKSS